MKNKKKSYGKDNHKGLFKFKKTNNSHNAKISLELLFDHLAKNNGIISIDKLNKDLSLNHDEQELLLNKIHILEKKNIVSINPNNNKEFLLNDTVLEEINLSKFLIIKIKSSLKHDHYIVSYLSLKQDAIQEDEFIIQNLNKNLIAKKIIVEVESSGEKIYATPLFYLDEYKAPTVKSSSIIIKGVTVKKNDALYLTPINFKTKSEIILKNAPITLDAGSFVSSVLISSPYADVLECSFQKILIKDNIDKSPSLISIYHYDLPLDFSKAALKEAEEATNCTLDGRKDITNLPLITIDDEDAKDFDDAIFAEELPNKEGSYKLYVAIADVAHYVPKGSALDIEAEKRGNSVYLPGHVLPMLPHALSNGLCSLNPNELRGCLLAEIIINHNGIIENFDFHRALMKSKARLTYKEVQDAANGVFNDKTSPINKSVIIPLFKAFKILRDARRKRNALDITTKEIKIALDDKNNILDITTRQHFESHQLVEEFMIAANVCAAKFIAKHGLSQKGLCIYRIHEQPSFEKITSLIHTLKSFKISAKYPKTLNGSFFNDILSAHKEEYFFNSLNELILRTQAQAKYDNINIGHFGLGLKEYCHFTSPIRRYADLMVHRLILSILDNNNNFNYTKTAIQEISEHISHTERIAFQAENSAKDRFLTKWFASKIGEEFETQISSVTHAGIFVNILNIGASGLIPMRTISSTYAFFNTDDYTIRDKAGGKVYKLGDKISAILTEADFVKGLLTFNLKKNSPTKKYK